METVYTRSSSVSIEEEIQFDVSWEGFYYNLWRCIRTDPKEDPVEGLNRARILFDGATDEERVSIRFALDATEESHNLKNSDGPRESSPPDPGQK